MSSIGLMMLIPGTLLAAGSVSLADVPALFIVLKSTLIVIGGLLGLKGQIEVQAPTGEWIVVKESKTDFGWHLIQ